MPPGTLKDTKSQKQNDELQLCMDALENTRVNVRRCAVEFLGCMDENVVVPTLIQALKDQDSWVRYGAVEALGRLKNSSALPHLEQLTADTADVCYQNRTVADVAREAIQNIKS